MVPIQTKLVDLDVITDQELNWLNQYNASVRSALLPVMSEKFPEAVEYLMKETEELKRQ
jgi:hypothetical protein